LPLLPTDTVRAVGDRACAECDGVAGTGIAARTQRDRTSPPATVLVPMAMLLRLLPSAWKPSATLLSP
jgi:hypothetical protein